MANRGIVRRSEKDKGRGFIERVDRYIRASQADRERHQNLQEGRSGEGAMTFGVVAEFDPRNGCGYIARKGERDLYVHNSEILGGLPGFKGLQAGDAVECEVGYRGKKQYARNVRLIASLRATRKAPQPLEKEPGCIR